MEQISNGGKQKVEKNINHNVTIENCKKINITAVLEVISAQDNCVVIKTEVGGMQIQGSALRVEKLSLEEKLLVLEGNISCVKYVGAVAKKSFFAKLFK